MAWFQGGRIKSSVLFSQIRWNSITILFRLNNSLFFVEKKKKIKKMGFQIQTFGSHWDLKAISKEEFKSCVLDLRTNFTALLTYVQPDSPCSQPGKIPVLHLGDGCIKEHRSLKKSLQEIPAGCGWASQKPQLLSVFLSFYPRLGSGQVCFALWASARGPRSFHCPGSLFAFTYRDQLIWHCHFSAKDFLLF